MGSNKAGDDDTIGQFGEGAKAAYVSMIKMGVHDPINISGDQAVVISVGPGVIEDMRPLVYHWFKITKTKSYDVCCKYLQQRTQKSI